MPWLPSPRPLGENFLTERWAALRRGLVFVAIVSFSIYFILTALGDLVPLEKFGASFVTAAERVTIESIQAGSPADRAGLRPGDRIVLVEGRLPRNAMDWAATFARVESGTPLRVSVQRDGATREHAVLFAPRPEGPFGTTESLVVVLTRLVQLVTLVFAIALGVCSTSASAALGFWLLATISIYSVGLPPRMATVWRQMPWPIEILLYVPSISKVLIGFILFAFFRTLLQTPLPWRRLLLLALPFFACVAWDITFLVSLLYRPELLPRLTPYLPFVIAVNFGYIAGAVLMLGAHYRTQTDAAVRRRLRWVVAGSVLGCAAGAPTVAGLWLGIGNDPTLMYHSPLRLQLAYTGFLVMPASFWWAIARGQLFDLRFVVRRGLQYVFARRALLVITPGVLAILVAEALTHASDPLRTILADHAAVYSAVAVALLVFRRFQTAWLDALDRRLFRERYDACQLLRAVAAEVRGTRDLRTAADCAVTQIDAALHPGSLAIYRQTASDRLDLLAGSGAASEWRDGGAVLEMTRTLGRPLDLPMGARSSPIEQLPREALSLLVDLDARLLVPAATRPTGPAVVLLFGPKRSGEPYSVEDKNLVHAVAESLADLAATLADTQPLTDGESINLPASEWNRRLWTLADAVARGSQLDWAKESAEAATEERRQLLLELQALERLMQIHGASSDDADRAGRSPSGLERWGRFELREHLGAGRFGTVYRAWDPTLEREVALKLLSGSGLDRAAYLREARNLARVRHPNVVHVYGAAVIDERPGFWMELVEGQTLADIVQRQPLTAGEAAFVGATLCRALSAIHLAGRVHQDVKAENVMRDRDGRLVLMDFGASTHRAHAPNWGTPRYMAPELFGGGTATASSDLYSLAVLLFFLVTRAYPVDGRSSDEIASRHRSVDRGKVRDLLPNVPEGFASAIERGLSPDPGDRFITAAEFALAVSAEGL